MIPARTACRPARTAPVPRAVSLADEGFSNTEIAERLGRAHTVSTSAATTSRSPTRSNRTSLATTSTKSSNASTNPHPRSSSPRDAEIRQRTSEERLRAYLNKGADFGAEVAYVSTASPNSRDGAALRGIPGAEGAAVRAERVGHVLDHQAERERARAASSIARRQHAQPDIRPWRRGPCQTAHVPHAPSATVFTFALRCQNMQVTVRPARRSGRAGRSCPRRLPTKRWLTPTRAGSRCSWQKALVRLTAQRKGMGWVGQISGMAGDHPTKAPPSGAADHPTTPGPGGRRRI